MVRSELCENMMFLYLPYSPCPYLVHELGACSARARLNKPILSLGDGAVLRALQLTGHGMLLTDTGVRVTGKRALARDQQMGIYIKPDKSGTDK